MPNFHEQDDDHPLTDQNVTDVVAWLASHRASSSRGRHSCASSCTHHVSCGLVHAEAWILRRTTGAEPMTTTALPPDTPKPEEQLQQHKPEEVSRRRFLFKLSIAANSIVGAFFAVPILGYLLGPVMKKEKAEEFWVGLGSIDQFPEGETRLANFRRPVHDALRRPDRRPPLLGDGASPGTSSRYSLLTALILAARCAGFRSRSFSCVPAMAELTIRTALAPPGRRSAACLSMNTKLRRTTLSSRSATCRPWPGPEPNRSLAAPERQLHLAFPRWCKLATSNPAKKAARKEPTNGQPEAGRHRRI